MHEFPSEITVPVSGPVDATVRPPGSKSVTNRALICAALAEGVSEVAANGLAAARLGSASAASAKRAGRIQDRPGNRRPARGDGTEDVVCMLVGMDVR